MRIIISIFLQLFFLFSEARAFHAIFFIIFIFFSLLLLDFFFGQSKRKGDFHSCLFVGKLNGTETISFPWQSGRSDTFVLVKIRCIRFLIEIQISEEVVLADKCDIGAKVVDAARKLSRIETNNPCRRWICMSNEFRQKLQLFRASCSSLWSNPTDLPFK